MTLSKAASGRPAAEPIAVIGLSAIFPGAGDLASYWAEILSGRDALTDIPAAYWSAADYYDPDPRAEDRVYAKRGGFLSPVPFEPLKYGIVPNDLPAIDSTHILALVAADRALADAGYPADGPADHSRTAVILGVTGALKMVVSLGSRLAHPQLRRALADTGLDEEATAEVLKRFANEFTPWVENSFPGLLGNVTAGRIAGRLDLGGTNLVVDAACASSLAAVRHALMELRSGQADLAITGGADAFNDPFMFACFSKTPALSPTGEVRAFDQEGDGTMLGEGVGLLVLKRLGEARRDGDRVYAVIREVGSSSDGRGAAIFAPTVRGQERALSQAYETADIDPGTVELVEGHGTGTNVGDAVEVEALTLVFSQSPRAAAGRPWCALGSVKSQIGHAKAAAGAAGLIKAALALHHKILPPAAKISRPLAVLASSPFHLSTLPRPWVSSGEEPRRAAVSAFGFGGSNFHCLLEEAGPSRPAPAPPPFELLALAADGPAGLRAALKRAETLNPALAARESRRDWRPAAPARLVLIAAPEDWSARLRLAGEFLDRPEAEAWPEGLFFGLGPAAGGAFGLLRPQAAEVRPNEGRELALAWPEMLRSLGQAQADLAALAPELGPLGQTLYPPDLASAEYRRVLDRERADPRLRRAAWRALAEGLAAVLARFGLEPAATVDPEEGGDLAALLDRPENRPVGFWVTLGPAPAGARFRPLGEGWPGLAGLLGRLAADGFPVDFTAWPSEAAAPEAGERPGFTVLVSGANQFEKKELPPSRRPAPAGRRRTLEDLAAETARLNQDFLRRQEEILQELRRERAESAEEQVLAAIARETGYPREMLSPDLSLESDLGLDSIKKVEILSALGEERLDLASRPAEALNEVVTVRDLIALLGPGRAGQEAAARPGPPGDLWAELKAVVARETGYPPDVLTPRMRISEDLGLDSIKMVEVLSLMAERLGRADPAPPAAALEAATLGELAEALAAGPGQRPEPAWPEPARPARPESARPARPEQARPEPARPEPRPAGPAADLVFEVVSRETGYPRNLLKPAMNLESDLGLDSIKKVEIISALGEKLGLAPPEAGTFGDLVTLADLAALAAGGRSGAPPAGAPPSPEDILLEVVSRETGYPRGLLGPAMDLESDLGLDSIRKVEIMSAVLERLAGAGLAGPAPEDLREARTLGELAGRLKDISPPAGTRDAYRPPEPKAVRRGPGRPPKNRFNLPPAADEVEARAAEQTAAYLVEAAPVALAAFGQAARPDGEAILVADEGPLAEALAEQLARQPRGGLVRRYTWRSVGDLAEAPENLGSLVLIGPEDGESLACPGRAFRVLKTAGPALRRTAAAGRPAQALGLTFNGGAFGFAAAEPAPAAPAGAALAGLFKTAAREWPEVTVRVMDLPREANQPAAGRYLPAILAAAAARGAPAEMGFPAPDRCVALRLRPYRLKNIRVRHLRPGQTVLVTGGARGVTAAALRELARSWSPHLVILGRTPLVQQDEEPEWLKGLTDEAAVRQALWQRAEEKPEPRELALAGARVLAGREVRTNLAALEKAGARVTYWPGDFEAEEEIRSALGEIKRRHGPIHGFIHGAGVLADSLILDKNEADFDRVFNTKARLARLILEELEGQPLNLAVFFSSSTARFGRRGQADYAAGNEYLNKLALGLARNRPGPKCLSVNWGPWDGGMVNESLARLFQDEGVGLISLSEGARLFASLVSTPKHDPVEVVVLGRGTRLEALAGGGSETPWA